MAHSQEKTDDLLDVMAHIARFVFHFCQKVEGIGLFIFVPGVFVIELIAQHKAERAVRF
jgi:hypothetical protein